MRYLIVDAYNIICATPHLRQLMATDLDSSRDLLAETIRSIHDVEGIRTAIVLDSKKSGLSVSHPFGAETFEFIYAPADVSADGVIERIVARLPSGWEATVVSNDRMIRESIRTNGGVALRPEELFEWAEGCDRRLRADTLRRQKTTRNAFRNGIEL